MKKIKLTQGKHALVDDEDYEYLNQWKWFFDGSYAARKNPIKIYMHRVINSTEPGMLTDHINRNKLDNRKSNLRAVTHRGNVLNQGVRSDNKTGITGVHFRKDRNKWTVYINNNGKRDYIGNFISFKDAVSARKRAEVAR